MENEIINQAPSFIDYLPYIVTVLCSIISGVASYIAARIKSKSDIQKLAKQHELDLEKEREKFVMEKEKMEIEYKYRLELQQRETGNQVGADLISTVAKEYMRSPAGRAQMRNAGRKK